MRTLRIFSDRNFLLISYLLLAASCTRIQDLPKADSWGTPEKHGMVFQRGKALTAMMCGPCHYDPQTQALSGKELTDIPAIAGRFYSANITRDSVAGAGAYTPRDLARLLRTGIKKDGTFSSLMVFPTLGEADLRAVIHFLQSNDPLVEPVSQQQPETHVSLPAKLFGGLGNKSIPYPEKPVPMPSIQESVAYGKYLVSILDCYACHSGGFTGLHKLDPEQSKGYMAGGTTLRTPGGMKIISPNLTPDPETGMGTWTVSDLRQALKQGLKPDGTPLRQPMPLYAQLSDREVNAIYDYLKDLIEYVKYLGRAS